MVFCLVRAFFYSLGYAVLLNSGGFEPGFWNSGLVWTANNWPSLHLELGKTQIALLVFAPVQFFFFKLCYAVSTQKTKKKKQVHKKRQHSKVKHKKKCTVFTHGSLPNWKDLGPDPRLMTGTGVLMVQPAKTRQATFFERPAKARPTQVLSGAPPKEDPMGEGEPGQNATCPPPKTLRASPRTYTLLVVLSWCKPCMCIENNTWQPNKVKGKWGKC